jgi:uncharacterized protein YxjI
MTIMKKLIIFSLILAGLASSSLADCTVPKLSKQFTMTEALISWGTTLSIESTDGQSLGEVKSKILSLTDTFTYYDSAGTQIAQAREEMFSWGTNIKVFDCSDKLIGSIKEEVLKGLLSFSTYYQILDQNGKQIAESTKFELGDADISITSTSGTPLVKMNRPWFSLTDNWTVDVLNQGIDSRILVMVSAFKTHKDRKHKND